MLPMRLGFREAGETHDGKETSGDDGGSVGSVGVLDGSVVSGLVRKIVAEWTRRYVGLIAVIVVVGLIVTITPSRPPALEGAKSSGGWSSYQPSMPSEVTPDEVVALPAVAPPGTSVPLPRDVSPSSTPQTPSPSPVEPTSNTADNSSSGGFAFDEPFPDFGNCLSGEPSSSTQLPIAQLLQVAGPILPLIGPITPLVLGLLPLLGPFLPKILPVIPMIQPFLDQITPAVQRATPSIVEFENRLLEPLMPYLDKQIPKLLDAERELVAALEPQARRLAGIKESNCVGVTVAAAATTAEQLISGDLARVGSPLVAEGHAQRVVTHSLRWSDSTKLREKVSQVAALDGEDVMVRLVLDEANQGDSGPRAAYDWVKDTIAALPVVSGWELSLPASGRTSNLDTGTRVLSSALTAALQTRRVGQLVGVGLPAALGDSSVLWGRLHDALSQEARSRINFLGITVPGVAMSNDDRKNLILRIRGAASGFTGEDLPIALSVTPSSEEVTEAARGWAVSATGKGVWLLSLDLASESSESRLQAANKAVALLRRGTSSEDE